MTTLLDPVPSHKGERCAIDKVLAQMAPELQAKVTAWFSNPDISGAAIGKTLRDGKFDVGNHSVTRHRRGECKCRR